MHPTEVLINTTDKPTSELSDEVDPGEDDELNELHIGDTGDENDQKITVDLSSLKQSNLSTNLKLAGAPLRTDGKRVRITQPRDSLSSTNSVIIKRDPIIESIIESRKFSIIDNSYTRLAQSTRPPQRSNLFDVRPPTTDSENGRKDRASSSHSEKKIIVPISVDFNTDGWDEGLTEEIERGNISSDDKTCLQLYEETCQRLNICPCSIILRSINTTKINLRNYGLGPRGCIPLAVGLIRNTTVLSLNLSGNNINHAGMINLHQIITENAFIEEYDFSYNNLGRKGNEKLAAGIGSCNQLKLLNVAGNELTPGDVQLLLSKLEDHSHLKTLNISHNQLDEEGGIYVAEWLSENHMLVNFDASWCSIRLTGAKAMAKAIGENNRLESLDLSHNSFTTNHLESIRDSLTSNSSLCELNLRGSHFICRYQKAMEKDPNILTTGKDSHIYEMLVAAATNQSLKILRLGENHIDERCLMIMLKSLVEVEEITLEELDLTGIITNDSLIAEGHLLFANHPTLDVYVGPVKQTIEYFANNLLNLIHAYTLENELNLSDIFNPTEGVATTITMITYEQFLDGLRKAKVPFPKALINDIMTYLGKDTEQGSISLKSLQT